MSIPNMATDSSSAVTAQLKQAQLKTWSAAASAWDRWFDWYVQQFQPVFDWCGSAVRVAPGMQLLDVACGAGEPAVHLAPRVLPGRVTAVDFAPEMVAASELRARTLGIENLHVRVMDAEALTFPDASFDAVTCVCGLMFCPDPALALAEFRRVLKPGGRLALVVWDDPEKNPFMQVAGRAAMAVLNPPPPPPDAPQAFRFRSGDVERLLLGVGFHDVVEESRTLIFHYRSVEEYLAITTDLAAALKAKLQTLPAGEVDRFRALVHANAAPYLGADGLRLPAAPLCVSATAKAR
jgi:SAM-dependent methyltransferase